MFSPSVANGIKTRHEQARERGMKDASEILWHIDGRTWNRYQMMALLVAKVAEGEQLVTITKDPAYPTLREVRGWYANHPDFLDEMQEATLCGGDIDMNRARLEVESVTEKDDVPAAKLRSEFYERSAARLNAAHQNKQVVKNEDPLDSLTEDQLKLRLVAMVSANPALQKLLGPQEVSNVQDAVILPQDTIGVSEGQPGATNA